MELEARAGAMDLASLARLSHELRTPLNAVLGFAHLMASDDADPLSRRQRHRLNQVVAAGEHLLAMVNEALSLSGGVAGRTLAKPGEVALSTAVAECIAMLEPLTSQASVSVHWESHEDEAGIVWADRLRLRQVLLNLLSKVSSTTAAVAGFASPGHAGASGSSSAFATTAWALRPTTSAACSSRFIARAARLPGSKAAGSDWPR